MGGQKESGLHKGSSGYGLQPVHRFLPFLERVAINVAYIAEKSERGSVENCERNRQLRIFFSRVGGFDSFAEHAATMCRQYAHSSAAAALPILRHCRLVP
jgi:hypothetical protein